LWTKKHVHANCDHVVILLVSVTEFSSKLGQCDRALMSRRSKNSALKESMEPSTRDIFWAIYEDVLSRQQAYSVSAACRFVTVTCFKWYCPPFNSFYRPNLHFAPLWQDDNCGHGQFLGLFRWYSLGSPFIPSIATLLVFIHNKLGYKEQGLYGNQISGNESWW